MNLRYSAVIFSALLLTLTSCAKKEEATSGPPKRPSVPVVTAIAALEDFTVSVKVFGTVEAVASTPIKAQVGGQMVECLIREGQRVKAGDPLFRIDPKTIEGNIRLLEADRDRIDAQAASAEAQVKALEAQARTVALQADAALAATKTVESQAGLAEAQYARYASLADKEYVSKEALDQTRTAADVAKANLAASRAQADAAKSAAQSALANVEAARAQANAAKAARGSIDASIANAKLQLSYTLISCPIDGQAGALMADKGDYVKGSGDFTLVVINQLTPVLVRFTVPETILDEVRKHNALSPLKVIATLPDATKREGRVVFIDNAVDRTTGTVALKASFANEDAVLWPGQLVDLNLELNTLKRVVTVPSPAIQSGQKGPYAYVVGADESASFRSVKPGFVGEGRTVVDAGLTAGERVVVDGHLKIVAGAKVVERPAPGAAHQTPSATIGTPAKPAAGAPGSEGAKK